MNRNCREGVPLPVGPRGPKFNPGESWTSYGCASLLEKKFFWPWFRMRPRPLPWPANSVLSLRYTSLLLALLALTSPRLALADNPSAPANDALRPREDALALMVDRARASAGVLPLARAPELDQAAIAHANEMVADGYMDHDAPDGSTPVS